MRVGAEIEVNQGASSCLCSDFFFRDFAFVLNQSGCQCRWLMTHVQSHELSIR